MMGNPCNLNVVKPLAVFIMIFFLSSCIPMLDPQRDNPWDPQGDKFDSSLYDGYWGIGGGQLGTMDVRANAVALGDIIVMGDNISQPMDISPVSIDIYIWDPDNYDQSAEVVLYNNCVPTGYSIFLDHNGIDNFVTNGFFFDTYNTGNGLDFSCAPYDGKLTIEYWDHSAGRYISQEFNTVYQAY